MLDQKKKIKLKKVLDFIKKFGIIIQFKLAN
jgi:hypothetical protein